MWQSNNNFVPFEVQKYTIYKLGGTMGTCCTYMFCMNRLNPSWGMLFVVDGNSSEFSEVASNFPYELCTFFAIL